MKIQQRRWAWPIGLVVVVLTLTACDSLFPRRMDPVVKIGLVAPFEGRHPDIGYDVVYSARLAVREANARSGPGQTKVALVAVDDFGDVELARQSAAAMAIDPDVVAVIGHWLPATTAAAETVYKSEDLPFIAAGDGLFGTRDPAALGAGFLGAYEEITPFDEVAGPYAGAAYDGMNLIIAALEQVDRSGRAVDRAAVGEALETLTHDGITGVVRAP